MPVRQMLDTLSSSELVEYMAFDSIEPFGDPRADLRAGIVASAVVNHSMSPPKNPTRPTDFMPFLPGRQLGPVRLKDKVAHGKLLAETIFGGRVQKHVAKGGR